jgi:hypothetical protein
MAVLRFREAAAEAETGEPTMRRAIDSDRMSVELTVDGVSNSSPPKLPTPTEDLAAKLAAADAAISGIEELLGKVRASQNEVRQSFDDLKRERDGVARPRRAAYGAAVVAAARGLRDGRPLFEKHRLNRIA